MLFWGWGRKNMTRQISPQQAVLLTYRYLHLMFVFTTTWWVGARRPRRVASESRGQSRVSLR